MENRKRAILAAVLLAAVAAGLFLVYRAFAPSARAGDKTVTIAIVHADGSRTEHRLRTGETYLREALMQVAEVEGEMTQYGFTLYTVDGETADLRSAYWAIYVDGGYGTFSIDKQPLADGASYEVIYESL